ncbi:MAG: ABC transporter substrate-binding protein [Candidatus Atribacteria bacterium]|nr:ABC transporter substrate-binding protein [Candidatus Atribacteria bacterium]
MFLRRLLSSILVFSLVLFILSAMAWGEEQTLKKVRVGITPYAFSMMFPVIHETGIDHEVGVDFDLVDFPSSANTFQILIRGDVDMLNEDMSVHIAKLKNSPEVRTFGTNNLFKGFILIGRKGSDKSYEEVLADKGNPDEAKKFILNSLKGRKFVAAPFFAGVISDALQQVGLKLEDIEYVQFADDQKAASAFISGVGDFYLGSLPQEIKMLSMPDKFINMGGNTEIMGPASLFYGGILTTEKYLKENNDVILRVMAAFYRGAKYLQDAVKNNDVHNIYIQLMKEELNKRTAGTMPDEDMFNTEKKYEEIFTYERAWEVSLNPQSKLYWKITGDYQMKVEVGLGHLDQEYDLTHYFLWEKTYADLTQRKDLMDFINQPLTPLSRKK